MVVRADEGGLPSGAMCATSRAAKRQLGLLCFGLASTAASVARAAPEPSPAVATESAEPSLVVATEVTAPPNAQPGTAGGSSPSEPELEVEVVAQRAEPQRSASTVTRTQDVIRAAPHRTGGDLLSLVPGMFITQHSGQGKAYQVFYRGFDAVHGQDLEFWVGGAPVNEVSNLHGQGYADLHFVMPEVVSRITVLPGTYSPEQGDFAVAGTIRYELGYAEPGVTAKLTRGSFGEQRAFLAYHPSGASVGTFAAFETQSTDGFGPARAAKRSSVIGQQVFRVGEGQLRLLATGYAARFDSPGVVSLREVEAQLSTRFDTYGIPQGGYSSRVQLVTEYSVSRPGLDWSIAPYAVSRSLSLKQNYTGYLLNEQQGDLNELSNDSRTLGMTGHLRQAVAWLSSHDSIEAGISFRNDWTAQDQQLLATPSERPLATQVDAHLRTTDAAGWLEFVTVPVKRLKLRAGLRVDSLAYLVRDSGGSVGQAGVGSQASRSAGQGGQARSSIGTHYGPKATADLSVAPGLHALLSYGEGFRSAQARSLGDGEVAPFTTVQSLEAGLRYVSGAVGGSLSAFRSTLNNELVFNPISSRNETAPASRRLGLAIEFVAKPNQWFVSSASGTFTRAQFTQSDSQFHEGDRLPYVPELVWRQDLAFTPELGQLWSRRLVGRFGTALTGMLNRPQPYGLTGHQVFLVDGLAELRLRELALGLDAFNLLDAKWYDSEFTYSANFHPNTAARLVPERYVTVGAPRTLLVTLSWYAN